MPELTHGPNTIAERIVTELERRGVIRFGPAFQQAQNLIADILLEEMCRPTMQEFAQPGKSDV